jgi:aspartyl-tRNA(Asn)/glutamyl-tRNA(Gln) amidotransferase subunit C
MKQITENDTLSGLRKSFWEAINKMSLQISDINRLAHLARLQLSPDQANTLLSELNGIFGMIEQLQAVNTEATKPMSHPLLSRKPPTAKRIYEMHQRSRTACFWYPK